MNFMVSANDLMPGPRSLAGMQVGLVIDRGVGGLQLKTLEDESLV